MAGLAFFRRAFKDALYVTGFAGQLLMGAGQGEARPDMIEIDVVVCLGRSRVDNEQQKQR